MRLGYRIYDRNGILPGDHEIVQIPVWHNSENDLHRVKDLAEFLKGKDISYLIHPGNLFLSETRTEVRQNNIYFLLQYSRLADVGIILHDETCPDGSRLTGIWKEAFEEALDVLEGTCLISIENANHTPDILWFWKRFAHSITFDIGHFHAAGMDAMKFLESLDASIVKKLDVIHLHRKGEQKDDGLVDHHPLTLDCPELTVFRRIVELRPSICVILEIDGEKNIRQSLQLARKHLPT